MAIACIIFSHQSKLLASSFDLPAIIVNFPFANTCYTNGPFMYAVFLTVTNLYLFNAFLCLFSIYVMFLLYVHMFTICSCDVVLKVYLLTYLRAVELALIVTKILYSPGFSGSLHVVIFDLLIPKANQHIYEPIYNCDPTWVKFPSLFLRYGAFWVVACCDLNLWPFDTKS